MRNWIGELGLFGLIVVAAAIAGAAASNIPAALLVAAIAYLAWHLAHLARMVRALHRDEIKEPYPAGVWGDVWQAVHRTQTDKREAHESLVRFDSRFRDAAAVFPDALVVLTRSGRIRWCNPAAEDTLFDRKLESVRDHKLDEFFIEPALRELLVAEQSAQPLILSRHHNRSRVLSIRLLPFGRKKNQRLLVASDITRVHNLDAARRDFLANVSHELRTPLTVISGYLEPLGEHLQDDPAWAHTLQLMQLQATRMRQMIDELTLLSQLESKDESEPPTQTDIDVGALIDEIVGEAQALDVAAGHQIEVAADATLQLRGIHSEIRSAISNLAVNALRHTPIGTHVEIKWHRHGSGAAISVTDDGPGIDAQHLPRLTERFYRVDPGRSRASGGTGLGLAIVRHILIRHEAQLSIDSVPGRGSTFRCEFPPTRIVRSGPAAAQSDG